MKTRPFPKDFLWGTATAGHQIEGNNVHSNWWEWEKKGLVNDGTTSGRACDYWNRWREDHKLMKDLGHNAFRLGIEWSRIEPAEGGFDEAAIDQYRAMLDDLQRKGIKVCLTLNHWVVPLWFSKQGGFAGKNPLPHWEKFIEKVIPRLGGAVDLWITLNEPMVPILAGYTMGYHPPCKTNPIEAAKVFDRLLRAHTSAYHSIHRHFSKAPDGGPVMAGFAGAYQHMEAWHNELSLRGLIEQGMAYFAAQTSYTSWDDSILTGKAAGPWGVGQEIDGLKDSTDYLGVNYYMRVSTHLALGNISNVMSGGYDVPEGIEKSDMGWQIYPPGFYQVLRDISTRFKKPIYITENGCADTGDDKRRMYVLTHLAQVSRAIQNGSDIRGYFHWCFVDNFEWREGFAKKFGMVAMDHDDPALKRTPKPTAYMMKDIIQHAAITPAIVEKYSPGALDKWP